jgi:hypothetical protein
MPGITYQGCLLYYLSCQWFRSHTKQAVQTGYEKQAPYESVSRTTPLSLFGTRLTRYIKFRKMSVVF